LQSGTQSGDTFYARVTVDGNVILEVSETTTASSGTAQGGVRLVHSRFEAGQYGLAYTGETVTGPFYADKSIKVEVSYTWAGPGSTNQISYLGHVSYRLKSSDAGGGTGPGAGGGMYGGVTFGATKFERNAGSSPIVSAQFRAKTDYMTLFETTKPVLLKRLNINSTIYGNPIGDYRAFHWRITADNAVLEDTFVETTGTTGIGTLYPMPIGTIGLGVGKLLVPTLPSAGAASDSVEWFFANGIKIEGAGEAGTSYGNINARLDYILDIIYNEGS
jgi:hypothetical protein